MQYVLAFGRAIFCCNNKSKYFSYQLFTPLGPAGWLDVIDCNFQSRRFSINYISTLLTVGDSHFSF